MVDGWEKIFHDSGTGRSIKRGKARVKEIKFSKRAIDIFLKWTYSKKIGSLPKESLCPDDHAENLLERFYRSSQVWP